MIFSSSPCHFPLSLQEQAHMHTCIFTVTLIQFLSLRLCSCSGIPAWPDDNLADICTGGDDKREKIGHDDFMCSLRLSVRLWLSPSWFAFFRFSNFSDIMKDVRKVEDQMWINESNWIYCVPNNPMWLWQFAYKKIVFFR